MLSVADSGDPLTINIRTVVRSWNVQIPKKQKANNSGHRGNPVDCFPSPATANISSGLKCNSGVTRFLFQCDVHKTKSYARITLL